MTAPQEIQTPVLVSAAIMRRGNSYLLTKRKKGTHLGGFWEFPGGKVERGETPVEALARELFEEVGLRISLNRLKPYFFSYWDYETKSVLLLFYRVELDETEEPRALEVADCQEFSLLELKSLELPPANRELLEKLLLEEG